MFMASRGMMVLDQNQLEAMSGSPTTDPGYNYCVFSIGTSESSPTIAWKDEMMYIAIEPSAMFGQGTMDAKAITQVYIDFCRAFPNYEIYAYGDEIVYMPDQSLLQKLSEESGVTPAHVCDTMDEFLNEISNH